MPFDFKFDAKPIPDSFTSLNVLLIDDDRSHLNLYMEALGNLCQMKFAKNLTESITLIKEETPDLIILDIKLGHENGLDLFVLLQSIHKCTDIAVVLLSSCSDIETKIRAYELGAIDYIEKTEKIEALFYKIKAHLVQILKQKKLSQYSYYDGLTGIPNRRNFNEKFLMSWKRALRNNSSITIILFDIDDFGLYNYEYGHIQGDETLKSIAAHLNTYKNRGDDLVARYGGEEFIFLLPECSIAGADFIAEKAVLSVKQLDISHSQVDRKTLTVSAGIATLYPKKHHKAYEILERADRALYKAKSRGKNQHCNFDIVFSAEPYSATTRGIQK